MYPPTPQPPGPTFPPARTRLARAQDRLAVPVGWILIVEAGLATAAAAYSALSGQTFRTLMLVGFVWLAITEARKLLDR